MWITCAHTRKFRVPYTSSSRAIDATFRSVYVAECPKQLTGWPQAGGSRKWVAPVEGSRHTPVDSARKQRAAQPEAFIPYRSRLTTVQPAAAAVEGTGSAGVATARRRGSEFPRVRPREQPVTKPGSSGGRFGIPERIHRTTGGRGTAGSPVCSGPTVRPAGRRKVAWDILVSDDPSGRRTTLQ